MKRVFADTGYWIALLHDKDELHVKALEVSKELTPVIITSELIRKKDILKILHICST